MDISRFDHFVSRFARTGSRRGALGLLVAGALAGLLSDTDVGAKNKKNGKGNGKRKKKGCGRSQKACGKRCIPKDACCSLRECDRCARELCLNGTCGCNPDFIRFNGVCGQFPTCRSVGEICGSNFECCSDDCIPTGGGISRCIPGTFQCLTDFDCVSGPCRGFMCPEQYQANVGEGC